MKVSKVYLWLCLSVLFSQVGFSKTFFKEERMLFHVTRNDFDKAKRMMDKGADVNARRNKNGQTSLYIASRKGYENLVDELITRNADRKIANYYGTTPLLVSLYNGHLDIANKLIDVSILGELNIKGQESNTALHYAIKLEHADIAKKLVRRGADLYAMESSATTPMILAIMKDNLSLVNLMISEGYQVNYQQPVSCQYNKYKYSYDYGQVVAYKEKKSTSALSALMVSTKYPSQLAITQALIDAGSELDLQDRYGDTALMHACKSCQVNKVEVLVKAGSSLSLRNFSNRHALQVAIENGCTNAQLFIKSFLESQMNQNVQQSDSVEQSNAVEQSAVVEQSVVIEQGAVVEQSAVVEQGAVVEQTDAVVEQDNTVVQQDDANYLEVELSESDAEQSGSESSDSCED